jgi:hypothetical protein
MARFVFFPPRRLANFLLIQQQRIATHKRLRVRGTFGDLQQPAIAFIVMAGVG